jgi:hypothetical protein
MPQSEAHDLVTDIVEHAFLLLGLLAGTRLRAGDDITDVRKDLLPIYKRMKHTMGKLGRPVANSEYGTPFVQALFFEEPIQENDVDPEPEQERRLAARGSE